MKVRIDFVGGFMDGHSVCNMSSDANESAWAGTYYVMTEKGTVGKRFRTYGGAVLDGLRAGVPNGMTTRGFDRNRYYQIAERIEEDGGLLLRARYVGQALDRRAGINP